MMLPTRTRGTKPLFLSPSPLIKLPFTPLSSSIKHCHHKARVIWPGKGEIPVAAAQRRKAIIKELTKAQLLGSTQDGKKIFLCDLPNRSPLLKEIGRLREITFRAVGEGTGKQRDIDRYDHYYRHILLWDDTDLEIVGCYRLAEVGQVIKHHGVAGLYSHTLFDYQADLTPLLKQSIELGRSFVQAKYWGSRALDYLWQGIGAYLKQRPDIRWMFGPVSISGQLPASAKEHLVFFYQSWFGKTLKLASARHPFRLSTDIHATLNELYPGENYKEEFRRLRQSLLSQGASVPTLYKQYADTFEDGGICFADFNIDAAFGGCVDGLVLADLNKLKPEKRLRYMSGGSPVLRSA